MKLKKIVQSISGGLKKNDIILEIDGKKFKSIMDASKYINDVYR